MSTVKKLIRRLIAWEVDPLREQLADLQRATTQAAENADLRIEEVEVELDHIEEDER